MGISAIVATALGRPRCRGCRPRGGNGIISALRNVEPAWPAKPAVRAGLILGLALLFALGSAALAHAKRYYVDPSGNDRHLGHSRVQAWRTVARVNRASLEPGDVVVFQAGRAFRDAQLSPRSSGTRRAPIRYGSYGGGQATLTRGVRLAEIDWISIEGLRIHSATEGIMSGEGSGARHIALSNNKIHDVQVGINSSNGADSAWRITQNRISRTGDSGLIAQGDSFTIIGNTITQTGDDSRIDYGKHGIYSKSANARIVGNRIIGFSAEGISTRFRNAVIANNVIRNGQAGIGYWHDDPRTGRTLICGNTISNVRHGILLGGDDSSHQAHERFRILGNTVVTTGGPSIYLPSFNYPVEATDNLLPGDGFEMPPSPDAKRCRRSHSAGAGWFVFSRPRETLVGLMLVMILGGVAVKARKLRGERKRRDGALGSPGTLHR